MTSLTAVLFLKRRLLKVAKSPVLSTGGNDNSKSRYGIFFFWGGGELLKKYVYSFRNRLETSDNTIIHGISLSQLLLQTTGI